MAIMTQRLICDWGDQMWPESSLEARMKALIEEVAEAAVVSKLDAGMVEHFQACIDRARVERDMGNVEPVDGEFADIAINLYHLADGFGVDVAIAVDNKMLKNMSRPKSHYDAKAKLKAKQGIR
jgi:NTP pyrophosphatase (non-canonical NTP hydrolase)